MLIIGLLKSIGLALTKYRSRIQLKQLSEMALKDIALSQEDVKQELQKATLFGFLKDVYQFKNLDSYNTESNKR